jgi:hypothetical protein|eukprot:gene5504-3923_t
MEFSDEEEVGLVVAVAAESEQTGNIGMMIIQKHHETSFSVAFCAAGEAKIADIDCVNVDIKERRVNVLDPMCAEFRESSYIIGDRGHLQLFVDAQADCQRVCNLYLELSSRFRDAYHGAVYSEVGLQHGGFMTEELLRLQSLSLRKVESEIRGELGSTKGAAETSGCNALDGGNVRCFYCAATSADKDAPDFFNHPYVPFASDRSRIFMCSICLGNWKDYRDAAQQEQQLILAGEVNEEVCALCSDTPDTLILCASCQRSYCGGCLALVLGEAAERRISSSEAQWRCMACACRVSAQPLLSRDVWMSWRRLQALASPPPSRPPSSANRLISSPGRTTSSGSVGQAAPQQTSRKRSRDSSSSSPVTGGKNIAPELVNADAGVSRPRTQRGRGSQRSSGRGLTAAAAETGTDELFYFAQYIDYIERRCEAEENGVDAELEETDDACFLCKDGGEVVECDFGRTAAARRTAANAQSATSSAARCRCRKVYHSYCLDYEVAANVKVWLCPRHYCSACGKRDALRFLCAFCPLSLCGPCAPTFAAKYGRDLYAPLPFMPASQSPYCSEMVNIACEHCADQCDRLAQRDPVANARRHFTRLGERQSFATSVDLSTESTTEEQST